MDLSTIVSRKPEVMFSEIGDKIMTMNVDTGNYNELDPIGAAIWREIETPVKIGTLRDTLCARYDVSPDQCLTELSAFLGELAELDMLVGGASLSAEV